MGERKAKSQHAYYYRRLSQLMATQVQMEILIKMLDQGWESIDLYVNTPSENIPIPGRVVLTDGKGKLFQIDPDGSVCELVPAP